MLIIYRIIIIRKSFGLCMRSNLFNFKIPINKIWIIIIKQNISKFLHLHFILTCHQLICIIRHCHQLFLQLIFFCFLNYYLFWQQKIVKICFHVGFWFYRIYFVSCYYFVFVLELVVYYVFSLVTFLVCLLVLVWNGFCWFLIWLHWIRLVGIGFRSL